MRSEPTETQGEEAEPVQLTSVTIGAFGVRVRADGRTGREAWKLLRQRHPWVSWVAVAYATVLLTAVGALVLAVAVEVGHTLP